MLAEHSHFQLPPLDHELSIVPYLAADSGHYTAYSKHPLTDKWYYYNDETVTEV